MLKTEPGSTKAIPLWLVLGTVILFCGRIGLGAYEKMYPPRRTASISWIDPKDVANSIAIRAGRKPILYFFTADWSAPCQILENGPLSNKDVVPFVNENFVPCRVLDQKKEKGVNSRIVQDLEDKFFVSNYPGIVIALPKNNAVVLLKSGPMQLIQLQSCLNESLTLMPYTVGKEDFLAGRYEDAIKNFNLFLKATEWKHQRAWAACVFAYISCLHLGDQAGADKLIQTGLDTFDETDHKPGLQMMRYFSHQIPLSKLLEETDDTTERIAVHANIGMALFAEKKYAEAKEHLQFGFDNAPKDWFDFKVCQQELEQLKKLGF